MVSHAVESTQAPRHNFIESIFEPQPGFDFVDVHPSNAFLTDIGNHTPGISALNSFDKSADQYREIFSKLRQANPWFASRQNRPIPPTLRKLADLDNPADSWDMRRKNNQRIAVSSSSEDLYFQEFSQRKIDRSPGATVGEISGNLTSELVGDEAQGPKSKLNRSGRARYAAVHRHKKKLQDKENNLESGPSDVKEKREKYRENNRAAAAKYRAKKKKHVENIELDAMSLQTTNAILKAKLGELRDQHLELRNLALQHNAAVSNCHCGAIHQYHLGKAGEITSGFSNSPPTARVSPHESDSSSRTSSPASFERDWGKSQSFSSATPPGTVMARSQQFTPPDGIGFDHAPNLHCPMQVDMMVGSFPDFLCDPYGESEIE